VKPAKHAPSTKHVTEQPRHNVKKQPSVKLQIRVTKTKEKQQQIMLPNLLKTNKIKRKKAGSNFNND
jgi:colicin import membrane protein